MMKSTTMLAVLAMLVLALAAPVAMAQPANMRAVQNAHVGELTMYSIESAANMCAVNASFDGHLNSGPCRRALSPVSQAVYARAGAQVQYAQIIAQLPGVGSGHHGGFANVIPGVHFGGGNGDDAYGKYDDAALWGTVAGEVNNGLGTVLGHRRANKQMDQNHEIVVRDMDMQERELTLKEKELELRERELNQRQQTPVQSAPATAPVYQQHVPVPATSNLRMVINDTGMDVRMERSNRGPVLIRKDGAYETDLADWEQVTFQARGECNVVSMSDSDGNLSLYCQ